MLVRNLLRAERCNLKRKSMSPATLEGFARAGRIGKYVPSGNAECVLAGSLRTKKVRPTSLHEMTATRGLTWAELG